MDAYLLTTNKPVNSTKTPSDTYQLHLDVKLKTPCSIYAPVIDYSYDEKVINHNYLKLKFTDLTTHASATGQWRYYFLTDSQIINNNIIRCTYAEDVLGSFKPYILGASLRCSRTTDTSKINPYLMDSYAITTTETSSDVRGGSSPFTVGESAYYIVGTTLPISSGAAICSSGSTNYFICSYSQLSGLINKLNNLTGMLADINPIQYIVSVKMIPFGITEIESGLEATGYSQQTVTATWSDIPVPTPFASVTRVRSVGQSVSTTNLGECKKDLVDSLVENHYYNKNASPSAFAQLVEGVGRDPDDFDQYDSAKWQETGVQDIMTNVSLSFNAVKFTGMSTGGSHFTLTMVTSTLDNAISHLQAHPQYSSNTLYLNSSPFTTVKVSCPPFGDFFIDKNKLSSGMDTVMIIDLMSGSSTLEVQVGGEIVSRISGNLLPDIPLSSTVGMSQAESSSIMLALDMADIQKTQAKISGTMSVIGGAVQTGAGLATDNFIGAASGVGSIASGVSSIVLADKVFDNQTANANLARYRDSIPQVAFKPAINSTAQLTMNWVITQVFRHVVLPEYSKVGYPSCKSQTITAGNYYMVEAIKEDLVDGISTLERQILYKQLQEGFFAEN